jgi:peptide deformylase
MTEREVGGFHANVIQHEYDHLDGILYPMRVQDFSLFGFTEELAAAATAERESAATAERESTES